MSRIRHPHDIVYPKFKDNNKKPIVDIRPYAYSNRFLPDFRIYMSTDTNPLNASRWRVFKYRFGGR